MEVYVLEDTSHHLILGANYMRQHGLKLDFQISQLHGLKVEFGPRNERPFHRILNPFYGVKCFTGYQGVCSGSSYVHKKKLLVARSLGVVCTNYMVPNKVLNPTPNPHKGKPIGEFQILDGDTHIHGTELGNRPQVCHIIVHTVVFRTMTLQSRKCCLFVQF